MEEEADIADETAGEVQHAGDQVEAERLQLPLEAQISLGRLAAKCRGPIGFRYVDRAAVVAAELGREA